MQVQYTMGGIRRIGTVVKDNCRTCWVRIMMGATEYIIIKRHKKKHKVWVM